MAYSSAKVVYQLFIFNFWPLIKIKTSTSTKIMHLVSKGPYGFSWSSFSNFLKYFKLLCPISSNLSLFWNASCRSQNYHFLKPIVVIISSPHKMDPWRQKSYPIFILNLHIVQNKIKKLKLIFSNETFVSKIVLSSFCCCYHNLK